MFISSPIPQLAITISIFFEDPEDSKYCIDYFSNVSTTTTETGADQIDKRLADFVKRLNTNRTLVYFISAFLAYYLELRKQKDISEKYRQLMFENYKYSHNLSNYDSGYISGIFTSCLIADCRMNTDIKVSEQVEEAIKYIESEGFIAHIEKQIEE